MVPGPALRKRLNGLLASALLLTALAQAPPAAAADECLDGPASEASRDRPHLVDPEATLVAEAQGDIRAAWVSAAVIDQHGTLDFSLNIALSALPTREGAYVYASVLGDGADAYVVYRGSDGADWRATRARTELDLGSAGGRTIMNATGPAEAVVGEDGVLTLELPEAELEGVTDVGLDVETGLLEEGLLEPGQLNGLVKFDEVEPSCTASLS